MPFKDLSSDGSVCWHPFLSSQDFWDRLRENLADLQEEPVARTESEPRGVETSLLVLDEIFHVHSIQPLLARIRLSA